MDLKIPPMLLMLIFAALMWLADMLLPQLRVEWGYHIQASLGLVMAALVILLSAVYAFKVADTTMNPMEPGKSSQLVAYGVYKISRNPMYLAFLLLLLAWGFFLQNMLCLLVLPVGFVLYMNRFQIRPEERVMQEKFQEKFLAYKHAVRRWI